MQLGDAYRARGRLARLHRVSILRCRATLLILDTGECYRRSCAWETQCYHKPIWLFMLMAAMLSVGPLCTLGRLARRYLSPLCIHAFSQAQTPWEHGRQPNWGGKPGNFYRLLHPCPLIGLHHTWEHGCCHWLLFLVFHIVFHDCATLRKSSEEDAHVIDERDRRADKRPWKHYNTVNATFS